MNRCSYNCQICNKYEANSYSAFIGHIHQVHQVSGKIYSPKNGGKLSTKTVNHTCQLCGLILDWDRSPISRHLVRLHPSVSVLEYVQTFQDSYTDFPTLPENKSEKWMNGCIFECKKCNNPEHFTTRSKLILHLHQTHEMSIKEYVDQFKTLFSKFASHECKICQRSVRWDKDSIIAHLEKVHTMTTDAYVRDHLKEDYDVILRSVSRMQQKKKDKGVEKAAPASDNSYDSDWLNKCHFSCKICNFETQIYKGFLTHISVDHKITAKDYKEQNGELYSKVVHQVCQLCGHVMLWNR